MGRGKAGLVPTVVITSGCDVTTHIIIYTISFVHKFLRQPHHILIGTIRKGIVYGDVVVTLSLESYSRNRTESPRIPTCGDFVSVYMDREAPYLGVREDPFKYRNHRVFRFLKIRTYPVLPGFDFILSPLTGFEMRLDDSLLGFALRLSELILCHNIRFFAHEIIN
jgi:hypothetical protein